MDDSASFYRSIWPFIGGMLLLFGVSNSAKAEWRVITTVDKMTDTQTKYAQVSNADGAFFFLSRRPNGHVVATFSIPNESRDTLKPDSLIRLRVDKNPPANFYDPESEKFARVLREALIKEKGLAAVENIEEPAFLPRILGNVLMWNGDYDFGLPEDLNQLGKGSHLIIEYRVMRGGIEYAEFDLGNGVAAFAAALDIDLRPNPQLDAYSAAARAARKRCSESFFPKGGSSPKKWYGCLGRIQSCAKTIRSAEEFNACAAPAFADDVTSHPSRKGQK